MQKFLIPVKWTAYLLLDCHSFKLPEGTDSGACVLQRRQLPLWPLRCFFTISSSSFKIRKLAYPLTQYVYVWLFIGTQKWIYKTLRAALFENSNWGPTKPTKGFPGWGGCVVKNLPAKQETQETWVWSLGWGDLLEKERQPSPGLLPAKFHDRGVWLQSVGPKESDMT